MSFLKLYLGTLIYIGILKDKWLIIDRLYSNNKS